MRQYAVIETDAGLTVAEMRSGVSPEQVAEEQGGIVVDPGPYSDYDEAYDAALSLQEDEEDEPK